MKKLTFALCVFIAAYLLWHVSIFAANADWRDRINDPDYITGHTTKTYYSTRIF